MYGMGADSLAGRLSKATGRRVDLSEAQSHISKLFQRFPKIRDFMGAQKKLGADKGWVQTLGGRRRYLPALKSAKMSGARAYAERQAVNTVIQGSAADMTKLVRFIIRLASTRGVALCVRPPTAYFNSVEIKRNSVDGFDA